MGLRGETSDFGLSIAFFNESFQIRRKFILVIIGIDMTGRADTLEIGSGDDALGDLLRLVQGGHEDRHRHRPTGHGPGGFQAAALIMGMEALFVEIAVRDALAESR